ncbi:OAM dimerization domain-containing protein [Pseudomonadota bacterium]
MTEHHIKPYGDTLDDGIVQLAFTLPVENSAKASKAAEAYVSMLNFTDVHVVHAEKIADNFTYFVVYAKAIPSLDYAKVQVPTAQYEHMEFYEINALIADQLHRRITVIGATIGHDAHTVGIDAIMNMKGYNQDYGLERYPELMAINLGAQVPCETLIQQAIEHHADAILVSQTVTQKSSHVHNFTELVELLEAEKLRDRFILIAGGPKISNEFAIELGYDAGFGPRTVPSQVASFIVTRLLQKQEHKGGNKT